MISLGSKEKKTGAPDRGARGKWLRSVRKLWRSFLCLQGQLWQSVLLKQPTVPGVADLWHWAHTSRLAWPWFVVRCVGALPGAQLLG